MSLARTGRPETMAARGMVAAPHYLASQAGIWALQQGGNALDAAVAAGAVLSVVYPHMAGLGGDAFFMLHVPGQALPLCLNGSGYSGYHATIDYYADRGHESVPTRGGLSVCTVPAAVASWGDAHARWGALPWDQLLEPAMHYAEDGFPVSANLAAALTRHQSLLEHCEATRDVFVPQGRPYQRGEMLVQPDLAQTLRTLADDGPESFYVGDLAVELVAYLEEHGSLLTHQDFEDQASCWVDPLSIVYRGRTVYQFPPNSEGLEALLILNLLAEIDLAAMGRGWAQYHHALIEAAKIALVTVRSEITDPNSAGLDLEHLLSGEYAAAQQRLMRPDRAQPPAAYRREVAGDAAQRSPSQVATSATAYVAAADDSGMVASMIQSLHAEFGSGVVAGRTGVLLHNAGAAFSLQEDQPNHLEPHKRPAEPLMPEMVFEGERPWLALGTSGPNEAATLALLTTRIADFCYNVQQAIEAPRWQLAHGPDGEEAALTIEGRVPDSVIRQLREMGHDVKVGDDWSDQMGQAQVIAIDSERGVLHGGADPRGDGAAIGW